MSELPLIKTPTSATALVFQKSFFHHFHTDTKNNLLKKVTFPHEDLMWYIPLWQIVLQIYVYFLILGSNIKLQAMNHCVFFFFHFHSWKLISLVKHLFIY